MQPRVQPFVSALRPPGAAGPLVFWQRAEEVLEVWGGLPSEQVALLGLGRRSSVRVWPRPGVAARMPGRWVSAGCSS